MEREDLIRKYKLERELEKRECEKSYRQFVKSAWHVLEPETPLIWNWHLDYLCDEVQSQFERMGNREPKKYDLLINIPPRSLKSYIFTRMPMAWAWIHFPWMRFLTASYAADLALEHAVDTRMLIESDWYQENWGDKYELTGDQNVKSFYKNDRGGYRMTTSTGAKATGRGGNWVSVDDPLSAEEAESETMRARAIRWWTRTMRSRLNNANIDMFSVIMQRLHEEDLTGYILANQATRYLHICLPAEESDNISPKDLRKFYTNGYLFPARFGPSYLDPIKEDDPYTYAGQYAQRPSPEEGGIFKRQRWRYWQLPGMNLPEVMVNVGLDTYYCEVIDLPKSFDEVVDSWDFTFKDKKTSDYVVGQKWGSFGANFFLLKQLRGKKGFSECCTWLKTFNSELPYAPGILVEDKANGPAIINDLKDEISGLIPVQADASKHARAMPLSRKQQAGNVILPHPAIASWIKDFVDEFASFPNGAHDDQVDAGSQAINHMSKKQRIWPMYRPEQKKLAIAWKELSEYSSLIISQWVAQDLTSYVLFALWNARDLKLAIWDELTMSTAVPEQVKAEVQKRVIACSSGAINNLSKFEWIGNDVMFSRSGKASTTGTLRDGMWDSYQRAGIVLLENTLYDELGAIQLMARLFTAKSIRIDIRCNEVSRQLLSWSIEDGKPAPGHGYCRALCNMGSMLWESGQMDKAKDKFTPYSGEKEAALKALDLEEQQELRIEVDGNNDMNIHGWMS